MSKELFVYLYDKKIGMLKDNGGNLSFEYFDNAKYPISLSMPLKKKIFNNNITQKFFSNLLPEGNLREILIKQYGVKSGNIFHILEKLGGECAGAIAIYTEEQDINKNFDNKEEKISKEEFRDIILNLKKQPLLVGKKVRLSLAGMQEKTAIFIKNNFNEDSKIVINNLEFIKPNNTLISNYIIKPPIDDYENSIYNELFCMLLAKKIILTTPAVYLYRDNNLECLFINRYDRIQSNDNSNILKRLHQEDFCQILSIFPEKKYEIYGGPSIKSVYNILNQYCSIDDSKIKFLKYIVFNFIIGNNDAHGKNFSVLYKKQNDLLIPILAPIYDVLSTQVYNDLSDEMAMKIGGEYSSKKIVRQHFIRMAEELGIKTKLIELIIDEISKNMYKEVNNLKIHLKQEGIVSDVFSDIEKVVLDNIKRIEE